MSQEEKKPLVDDTIKKDKNKLPVARATRIDIKVGRK